MRSAEEAGGRDGEEGWEVERRLDAGRRAENRDWMAGRRPFIDEGRD